MKMHLVNKLLDIDFLCVNIDDEARAIFCLDLKELVSRPISNCGRIFNSLKTKKAIDNYEENKTIENHHLAVHFILIDTLVSYILRDECKWESINHIVNETLKCSTIKTGISEEIFNYFQTFKLKTA